MRLSQISMVVGPSTQMIKVIDCKTRRIRFEGTADELLDFSGCDYCQVCDLAVKDGVLVLSVRSN